MNHVVSFSVSGTPKTAGSKKSFRHKYTGKIMTIHDNPETTKWMERCAYFARQAYGGSPVPRDVPVFAKAIFRLPRPKGHHRPNGELRASAPAFPTTKPDTTKLWRAVEDSLRGLVWIDDSQVVGAQISKGYGDPGVTVEIYTLEQQVGEPPKPTKTREQLALTEA